MSKLPFFSVQTVKKLRIMNKFSGKTTYDDMEFLPLPVKRFWSFPPGADLITLFSLARSSGSLIVGPTFAGRGGSLHLSRMSGAGPGWLEMVKKILQVFMSLGCTPFVTGMKKS